MKENGSDQLHVYMVAWAIHRLFEVIGGGNQNLEWHFAFQIVIVTLTVSAIIRKSVRLWILAMIAVLFADLCVMPFIWDSEYWSLLTDFATMSTTINTLGWKRQVSLTPFTQEEKSILFTNLKPIIMSQMIIFYSAAFFWKLNWDFLNSHSSCAPVFAMQLLDHMLPSSLEIPDIILKFIVKASPILVLSLEGYITISLINRPRYGVLAAMVLHLAIAMCPPPSNVAPFSIMCASRLVLFVSNGAVAASDPKTWSTFEITATGLATAVTAKIADHEDFYDLGYPLFACCTPFVVKAALLHEDAGCKGDDKRPVTTSRALKDKNIEYVLIAMAFIYAYLFLVFGTMDQGQPHMYANLRLHGGSNHIFGVPTSLLQRWLEKDSSSAFGGGIVRIESSTLKSLNEIYPSDYTEQMSLRSRQFMIAGGHTSRNFNPMLTAVTSSEAPWDGTSEFIKYTMPADEFRRILHVARMQNESFVIEYTQLMGLGDEEWRSTAPGRTVRLIEGVGNGKRSCRVLNPERGESSQCKHDDLPHLPPLPFWARKLLLFEPYPILPGDYMLHCFGP